MRRPYLNQDAVPAAGLGQVPLPQPAAAPRPVVLPRPVAPARAVAPARPVVLPRPAGPPQPASGPGPTAARAYGDGGPGAPPMPAQAPKRPPALRYWRPLRGVLGDDVRTPMLWCEFGTCIARYADRHASSDRELRDRALTVGWRYDALGRLACPGCVRHDPAFLAYRPSAPTPQGWR
jgi:hypothetical protein